MLVLLLFSPQVMRLNGKFLLSTTFDAGINYKTQINKMPVKLSAMCYNLTGKDYWIAYGSGLHLSSPRTFMLSAQFDL